MDIGANPSAEGAGEDEGVDDQAVKVVDIVDTFRLQVGMLLIKVQWLLQAFKHGLFQFWVYRSNLLWTRSCSLHTLRSISNYWHLSWKGRNKRHLRRTLREQLSICLQSSRTCNCKYFYSCLFLCFCRTEDFSR